MAIVYVNVGGTWVPVGGGIVDPVWVAPGAPTDPNVELWFDTDASSFAPSTSGLEANRPAVSPSIAGLHYFATDTLREWLCDGIGWIVMSEPVIPSFVPAVAALTGAITTLGAVSFAYARQNGSIDWTASITITTNGTGATNISMSLPIRGAAGNHPIGSGREFNVTGLMLNVTQSGAQSSWIQTYANGYPGGNGYAFGLSGRYRMESRYS